MLGPALLLLAILATDPPPIAFRDVAAESGVVFRFHAGSRGKHDLPEIMGGGVAMIDVDGDGHLDLYFPNGGPIGGDGPDPPGALFRNNGDGTFAPLPDPPPGPPYAMGCAVGDYDGDGRDDLFVTGWRGQRLYRNAGGKFVDVTDRAGLACNLWTTAAAFADLDDDGDLDLFVAAYLDYDAATAPFVAAPDGKRDYAGPEDFPAQPDRLYRNNGDGTFTEISEAAGVDRPDGRGLGVLVADLVGDSKLDIFVANDGTPNFLFENLGDLRFEEVAAPAGVARDGRGEVPAGMGVALGEVDGRDTLFVGNFHDRATIAFAAAGRGVFEDATARLGLDRLTRRVTGFGLALADFDGDGRLDFLQANGHVLDRERLGDPFAMRITLLSNAGGRFVDASAAAGPAFARPILGRGLAIGDLDYDGRPDAVIGVLDGAALVLRNVTPTPPGLTLELVGKPSSNRAAIGAV
ncbi:MAG TPA: VCBS repeat-containing protein, partial [Isosphaeraceae bacterium]